MSVLNCESKHKGTASPPTKALLRMKVKVVSQVRLEAVPLEIASLRNLLSLTSVPFIMVQ